MAASKVAEIENGEANGKFGCCPIIEIIYSYFPVLFSEHFKHPVCNHKAACNIQRGKENSNNTDDHFRGNPRHIRMTQGE